MTVPAQPTLLDGVRVVELGAEISAPFAGKLLADAGADAIKIEPLGGDPARRMAPFATDEPHRETSTVFLQYNTSKRSVALDIESRAGQRVLQQLLAEADVFVTDWTPARLGAAGLAPEDLRRRYPRLIIAAVTPWGLDGPAAEWPSSALTRAHASGAAAGVRRNLGAAAGSPIMAGARVHEADAGLALALATWAALIARDTTGAGQIVDVAATEAMMTIDRVDISIAANDGGPPPIMSSGRTSFGGRMDCADGHVITVTPQPHQWTGLLKAMGDPAWAYDEHGELRDRIEIVDEASAAIDEWAGARTRDEVYRLLQAESAPAGPVLRPSEVMVSEQEELRSYFETIEHPVAGPATYSQFAAIWTETPRAARTAAPQLGEATSEITAGALAPWSAAQARRAGVIA